MVAGNVLRRLAFGMGRPSALAGVGKFDDTIGIDFLVLPAVGFPPAMIGLDCGPPVCPERNQGSTRPLGCE